MIITKKGGLAGWTIRHWCYIIFLTLHFLFLLMIFLDIMPQPPCSHIVFLALSSVCVVSPDQVSNPRGAEWGLWSRADFLWLQLAVLNPRSESGGADGLQQSRGAGPLQSGGAARQQTPWAVCFVSASWRGEVYSCKSGRNGLLFTVYAGHVLKLQIFQMLIFIQCLMKFTGIHSFEIIRFQAWYLFLFSSFVEIFTLTFSQCCSKVSFYLFIYS